MKNKSFRPLLIIIMVWLSSAIIAPVYAWQEVDSMNMCNQPVQVIRAYQGHAKKWESRDHYIAEKKRRLYARNCPRVQAPKNTVHYKRVHHSIKRKHRSTKRCRSCYKKGYKEGYKAAHKKHKHLKYRKVPRKNTRRTLRAVTRQSGYRSNAAKIADCKRVDWANNASRSKVIATW